MTPAPPAPGEHRFGARLSLPRRVVLLLAVLNVTVFLAGGSLMVGQLRARNEEIGSALLGRLGETLRRSIRPRGDVNVARILEWPGWDGVGDAILIDRQRMELGGRVQPRGVQINPVGALGRPADFDRQAVLEALWTAIDEKRTVPDVAGGWAIPIEGTDGTWGGIWYRTLETFDVGGLVRQLLGGFLISTVLLTGGTFLFLSRFVLRPVDQLARGARRMVEGDLGVRLVEPARRDELADLIRDFNVMAATVRGFNARLAREVELASEQARQAEQAAMTQRRLAAMGELAAGVAHEINNPLGGLTNAVQALGEPELSPARRERYLGLLTDGLERIGRTVRQLLRFTPRVVDTAPVDLESVTRDALALVRHRADGLGVELEFTSPPGGVPLIEGAAHELGQAVLNLLGNALDALEEGAAARPGQARRPTPRVEVELAVLAGELVLSVADNGPGVEQSLLPELADLFFSTKDVGRGTGLGLSIVHNAVDAHGGHMEITSSPGEGFRVALYLPLSLRDGGAPPRGEAPGDAPSTRPPSTRPGDRP